MNCKDLMIGDLVAEKKWEKYPLIIAQIRDGLVYAEYIGAEGKLHTFTEDLIAPIPLTEDILKANGFARNPLMKSWMIDGELELIEDTMGNMEIEYWFSISDQYICPIHHVHELQHALRLCGLNDIADNFKI